MCVVREQPVLVYRKDVYRDVQPREVNVHVLNSNEYWERRMGATAALARVFRGAVGRVRRQRGRRARRAGRRAVAAAARQRAARARPRLRRVGGGGGAVGRDFTARQRHVRVCSS